MTEQGTEPATGGKPDAAAAGGQEAGWPRVSVEYRRLAKPGACVELEIDEFGQFRFARIGVFDEKR